MRPVYVQDNWVKDTLEYERIHDWANLRDGNRVIQAHLLLDHVKNCAEGDYAEVGTYQGNYARLIYSRKVSSAKLYCFDTFEGFPDRDVDVEINESSVDAKAGSFNDTSMSLVRRNICGDGSPADLVFRKGLFPETFSGLEDRRWRFVLLDADLYAPIKAGLEIFWPRLVPGGVMIVHDYMNDYYEGAKKAVDEYFKPLGIVPVPWPDRVCSAVVIKPFSTN